MQPISLISSQATSGVHGRTPALFLAWARPSHTRRSVLLARQLGVPLRRIYALKMRPYLAPIRYPIQAVQTLWTLFRERPRLVLVQNPPIFAPLFVWLYCVLTGSRFIIDSHTGALHGPLWRWSWALHAFLSRRAVTTLVTNTYLQQKIQSWGAHSLVVMDVPSEFPVGNPFHFQHDFNIAVVSSFSADEPLTEITRAAADLPEVGFYVTGDPARTDYPLPSQFPPNVHLTGFLSEDDYYGLMRSAQAVMVLTTEDHTMQRGACEAVWLGQPIITSHWPILREAFHCGALHVDNTAAGIRAAVETMRARRSEIANEIIALQVERLRHWQQVCTQLTELTHLQLSLSKG